MRWTPVDNNCGTGAGGFKKGNTCAKGGSTGYNSFSELSEAVGIVPNKIEIPAEIKYYAHEVRTKASISKAKNTYQLYLDTNNNPKQKEVTAALHKLLLKSGFIAQNKYQYENTAQGQELGLEYIHPEGHQARLYNGIYSGPHIGGKGALHYSVFYVPKNSKEGVQSSKEALSATIKAFSKAKESSDFNTKLQATDAVIDANDALHLATTSDYKKAKKSHELLAKLHEEIARKTRDKGPSKEDLDVDATTPDDSPTQSGMVSEASVVGESYHRGRKADRNLRQRLTDWQTRRVEQIKLHKDAAVAHRKAADWYALQILRGT